MAKTLRLLLAFAAPLSLWATSARAQQPHYNWSGIYLGATAGWARSNVNWDYYNLPGQSIRQSYDSFMPGGIAGAQIQFGQFVVGVEGSISGNRDYTTGPDAPIFAPAFDARTQIKSTMTLGPRVGWAFDRFMVFGSGGFATSQITTAFYAKGFPGIAAEASSENKGWYLGGGVDYALTRNIIFGVEYRHLEFGTVLQSTTVIPATGSARYVDGSTDEVRARLTFKLGPQ